MMLQSKVHCQLFVHTCERALSMSIFLSVYYFLWTEETYPYIHIHTARTHVKQRINVFFRIQFFFLISNCQHLLFLLIFRFQYPSERPYISETVTTANKPVGVAIYLLNSYVYLTEYITGKLYRCALYGSNEINILQDDI